MTVDGPDITATPIGRPAKRGLSVSDLFPGDGHRYLSGEDLEELRAAAMPGDPVLVTAQLAMEAICDIRNLAYALDQADTDRQRLTEERDELRVNVSDLLKIADPEWRYVHVRGRARKALGLGVLHGEG